MAIIDLRAADKTEPVDRATPAPGREHDPAIVALCDEINRLAGLVEAPAPARCA